jgi:hypothetical protein
MSFDMLLYSASSIIRAHVEELYDHSDLTIMKLGNADRLRMMCVDLR